jgi:hypothetical protein
MAWLHGRKCLKLSIPASPHEHLRRCQLGFTRRYLATKLNNDTLQQQQQQTFLPDDFYQEQYL